MSGEYVNIPNVLVESNFDASNGEFNLYMMHTDVDYGDEWTTHICVTPLSTANVNLQTYDDMETTPDLNRRESLYLNENNIFHNNIQYTSSSISR